MPSNLLSSRLAHYAIVGALVAAVVTLGANPVVAGTTNSAAACTATRTTVSLVDDGPRDYEVYGELCRPAQPKLSAVQVLLPGATYNHFYWDLPYKPEEYSYVRHMNRAGYATYNIDRIGTGKSSHPVSALVSVPSNAVVVHQLVQALRAGEIGGRAYDKVVLVGHSLGTLIGMTEASRYSDVDGFIATGILHTLNVAFFPDLNPMFYPAMADPAFADRDPGYLSTRPGARGGPLFYAKGHFDQGALDADEEFARDTVTQHELALFPMPLYDGTATRITAPTLVVMGELDEIFCGGVGGADCSSAESLYAHEKPHYANAALTTYVHRGSGHCDNTHHGAGAWYAAATTWLDRILPTNQP